MWSLNIMDMSEKKEKISFTDIYLAWKDGINNIFTNKFVYLKFGRDCQIMLGFQKIIEKRIKEAQKRGEFDDLPGSGEPLIIEDDSHVPEDLRLAYKILKNADCLPPALELKREIRQMEDMLEKIPDEKEKYRQIKRINYKILQLNMMGRGSSPLLAETEIYYGKLVDKMAQKWFLDIYLHLYVRGTRLWTWRETIMRTFNC